MKSIICALMIISGQTASAQDNPLKGCMKALIAPRQVVSDFFAEKGNTDNAQAALVQLSEKITECEKYDPTATANIPAAKREAFLKAYKYAIKDFASGSLEVKELLEKNQINEAKAKWNQLMDFKELSHFATRYR